MLKEYMKNHSNFSDCWTTNDMFLSTSGRSGLHLTTRFSTANWPLVDGQYAGGLFFSIMAGASCDMPRYSTACLTTLKSSSSYARTCTGWWDASTKTPACTITTTADPLETLCKRAKRVMRYTMAELRPGRCLSQIEPILVSRLHHKCTNMQQAT